MRPPICRPRALAWTLSLLVPAAAQAQQDPVEQVVITAQKRAEALQSIPLSVTALDQHALEQLGVDSVADVARQVPGLTVVSSGPGQNILIMRGIASTAGTAGTVGYYLDDTPISASSNASLLSLRGLIDPAVFDIARVEVLRGPQGTLYGSSSMGGTVKYVTNQPDVSQFGAKTSATLSATDGGGWNRTAAAVLNLPLVENRVALRLSVQARDNDGFIGRYPVDPNNYLAALPGAPEQRDVNGEQTTTVHALLKARLDDGLTLSASLYHQHMALAAPFQIDLPPGSLDNLIQTRLVAEPSTQDSTLASFSVHKNWDSAELVASTSYYERKVAITEDASKVLYFFLSPAPQSFAYPVAMTGEYDNREFTQEVRLLSDWSGPLQWIGGAYYHHVDAPLASSIPVPAGYNAAFGSSYDNFFSGARQATVRETALFAEGAYQFAPAWTARVGLRAFRVAQGFAQQGDGVLNGGPSAVTGDSLDSGFDPKFNLAWQVDQDMLVFATASKGYRPGGPNNPAPASVCGAQVATLGLSDSALVKFGADSLWNYEIGEKSVWQGGKLTANASVYYIDWDKVQQQIVLQCGFNITANFGSATSKGAELELNYRPSAHLTLRGGASFTDATLNNDVPGTPAKRGDALLDVPRWSGSVSAEYALPLAGGLSGFARIDYSYTGTANTLYDRSSAFYQRQGFGVVNLRCGARAGGGWEGAVFVDNALNKIGETALPSAISADLPATRRIAINRPRTAGVTLSRAF